MRIAHGGLAVADRTARGDHLGQRTVVLAVTARNGTAEDVPARPPDRRGRLDPQDSLTGGVQSDDTSTFIDLDDDVGRAVDDLPELVALPFEGLPEAGPAER